MHELTIDEVVDFDESLILPQNQIVETHKLMHFQEVVKLSVLLSSMLEKL